MMKQFETERFTLVKNDRVRVTNYRFGHNLEGERDVWIERGERGERFLSQIILRGEPLAMREEIYTTKCYILRENDTGRYWFLDMNDCGFWLHSESFSGAETFFGDESVRIENWLSGLAH
ncbi:MAG TPA: hypothetical protein VFQ92_05515 [Blastocatellia bacterium]|nr:hypothetical protein [Blastocatellia bacterium]